MKKRLLLTSILSIVMCFSLICGATFALFTSESKVNIAVTSGTVSVTATATKVEQGSLEDSANDSFAVVEDGQGGFALTGMTPNDYVTFNIDVNSTSDVNVKYRIVTKFDGELAPALKVEIKDADGNVISNTGYTNWAELAANTADVEDLTVKISFPKKGSDIDNLYQGKKANLLLTVEAVQGNAPVVNPFTKLGERKYQINDEIGMTLMNSIIASVPHGEGQNLEFILAKDVFDMSGYAWAPIRAQWVNIDGQGNTIKNLNCGKNEVGKSGFISYFGGNSTIENVIFENVASAGAQVGLIAGQAEGGILIKDVTIAGNNTVDFVPFAESHYTETYNGAGVLVGHDNNAVTVENVTIASGATVTLNYNGIVSGTEYNGNEYTYKNVVNGTVTNNGTIIVNRDFNVTNDAELANAINAINTSKLYWNTPVTVNMAAGEYTGDYTLKQIPSWTMGDSSTFGWNTVKANNIDTTFVTLVGAENGETVMKGLVTVYANGNGGGYRAEVGQTETIFKNIVFNKTTDTYGISLLNAADYVLFEKCTFRDFDFIQSGSGGQKHIFGLTLKDCTFENGPCLSGYSADIDIINCNGTVDAEGFINNQMAGPIDIVNSNVSVSDSAIYFIRTNGKAIINVTGSTVGSSAPFIWFRAEGTSSATVTNTTFKKSNVAITVVEGCTYTIDGVAQEVLKQVSNGFGTDAQGNYYIYTAKGLQSFNDSLDDARLLDMLQGKTIKIMTNIDATGVTWVGKGHTTHSTDTNGFVFDGQGHTISNLTIEGKGLFNGHANNTGGSATEFKNITFDNVTVDSSSTNGFHIGVVWGEVYGDLVLNNVKVINSRVTGKCNVSGLVGRNAGSNPASIKFISCSVIDSVITAEGGNGVDNCGASAFLGMALKQASQNAYINLVFEGTNVANGNTLTSASTQQGGGIYAKANVDDDTWTTPVPVTTFDNYNNN
ncbi:MAG: hypothetical protein IJA88_02000 [Clostridia bacterium]|nr:hypothetical protein [Clostridia bacterium]